MADWNGFKKNGTTYIPNDATARERISAIEGKIPSAASSSNKLVDTSTMTTELNGKVNVSSVGANNGVAELDANGRVPSSQLPSYVDDVLEYASQSAFPATGETGKIYIALDTNKTYRWSGSAYVEISESLALGETSSTAYAGNKGKANADAIAAMKDGSSIDSFGDVETALVNKVDKVQGKGLSTNDYNNTAKGIVDNVQSNIIANTKLIKDTVGWSGKNKLTPQWNRASGASSGNVTMTYGNDRIVSLSGVAGSGAEFDIKRRVPNNNDTDLYLPIGKYKYTIGKNLPSGISVYVATTYNGAFKNISGSACAGGVEFEITADTQSDYKKEDGSTLVAVYFSVANGKDTSGIKLYPMITDVDILDSTYEPYFGSTAFPRSEQAVLGAKNIMPYPYRNTTKTDKGITFTDLGTGVIEVNGYNDDTDTSSFTLASENTEGLRDFLLKIGSFKISGGISNDIWISFYNYDGAGSYVDDKGSGANITFTNRMSGFNIILYVRKGAGVDHLNVRPMLTLLGDNDSTYQYPALTNQQITYKLHHLVHRVVYASTDDGRSDLTIAADGFADISISSITGYRILTANVTITGAGSSVNAYVSGAGGSNIRRIVNRGSQSYTWGYEVEVYYIATDEID